MEDSKLTPSCRPRVLIVDDEALVASYFNDLLLSRGCKTTVFNDSRAALDNFKSCVNNYDLVLSDITMPFMSGDQLAAEILNIQPDIYIVLCSGHTPSLNVQKLFDMGVKAFLQKPIDSSRLLNIVEELRVC